MKQLVGHDVGTYAFNKTAGTVTISGVTLTQEQILLVVDTTAGVVLYNFANTAQGGTFNGGTGVLTLTTSTAALNNADALLIYVDVPAVVQAVSGTFWQATQPVSGTVAATIADGSLATLGAKADAKSTATDATAITVMQVLKEISYMEQNPASRAVTNAGTFAVQATLAAETTKVIGTVNQGTSPWVCSLASTTVTGNVAVTLADGADTTLGAKADAKSVATDTTAVSIMSVLKEISYMEQNPASRAVTNAGTFAVQAACVLGAETTKVIGTVNQGTSPWVCSLASTTVTGNVAVTVASGAAVSGAFADGSVVTLGAKADARSASTDATAITVMQVLKQISYMEQNPASCAVTNGGTFAVQAAITAASGSIASGAIASGAIASGAIASGAIASGAVASGAFASGSISDGAMVTLGAKADAKSSATDSTAITVMQVLKQISYMTQNPLSPPVVVSTLTAWTSANFTSGGPFTVVLATGVGCEAVIVQLDQGTTITGGAVTWQGTYDGGANWVTIPAQQVLDATSATFAQIANPYTLQANTNKTFLILMGGYQQVRASCSSSLTGTGTITPYVTQLAYQPVNYNEVLQATAANLNATVVGTGTFAVQAAITAASGSIASGAIASGAIASGAAASGAFADGSLVTLGAKADAKSAATDGTAITAMQVLKQISYNGQNPASTAVTNIGTFAVQAACTAASGAFASGSIASGAIASGAIASGAIASGAAVSGAFADGSLVTLGAKADARSTSTDATAITVMQVLKQISYMEQNPASCAVTNGGTFAVQSTNAAETTKVIGTVRVLGNTGATVDAAPLATAPTNGMYNLVRAATTYPGTAATDGQTVSPMADHMGKTVVVLSSPRELVGTAIVSNNSSASGVSMVGAGASNVYRDITAFAFTNRSSTATVVTLTDGTLSYTFAIGAYGGIALNLTVPIPASSTATAWTIGNSATVACDYFVQYVQNK